MRSVFILICVAISAFASDARAQSVSARSFPIARGWARNQINTVIFRKNSLTSHGQYQYAAFYNEAGKVELAKRRDHNEIADYNRNGGNASAPLINGDR